MQFTSPGIEEPLEITGSIDLPSDNTHDEISIQTLESSNRQFQTVGIYTESHRGAFGNESWEHKVYYVDKKMFGKIKKFIKRYTGKKISREDRSYKKVMKLYKSIKQFKSDHLLKGDHTLSDYLL